MTLPACPKKLCIVCSSELLAAFEAWRAQLPDSPSRAEAGRRLIAMGLLLRNRE